jgi:hypothetical protein
MEPVVALGPASRIIGASLYLSRVGEGLPRLLPILVGIVFYRSEHHGLLNPVTMAML